MSLLEMLILPSEILETIFKLIEPNFLKLIQDIPQIRPYVLRALYSNVTLNHFRHDDKFKLPEKPEFKVGAPFRDPEVPLPDVLMLDQLLAIIKENDLPPPRKIYFNDPMDLVDAHYSVPELLKNCEIGISFNYYDIRNAIDEGLLKELKEYPYNITRLDSYSFMDESKYGSNEKWFNNVKSLNLKYVNSWKTLFRMADFDNLVDLSLHMGPLRDFEYTDFELLPPNLKKFACDFDRHETGDDDISQIKFPIGLTELHFSIFPFTNGSHEETYDSPVLDLSYLENLKILHYYIVGDHIKFPKNLLELESDDSVPLDEVCRSCPDLVKLKCDWFCDATEDFPEKVTDLTIGVQGLVYFYRFWQCNEDYDSRIDDDDDNIHFLSKILSQLHHFTVCDDCNEPDSYSIFPKKSTAFDFSNMKTFKMLSGNRLNIGEIPSSLTSLRVCGTKDLTFSKFKHFDNLVDVCFTEMNDISKFKCKFGPSLKYLEIDDSKIEAIDIISPNLKYLVVNKTLLSTINQTTFKVPQSLIELDISGNCIWNIDDSFRFPDNLQVLDISSNELSKLENLPPNLKKLRCGDYTFDPDEYDFLIPSSLEVLEMTIPEMVGDGDDECTKFIDFSNCNSLKYLDMSFVNYWGSKLSLDTFPKSLVFLRLSGIKFDEIEGNFTDFENLKNLVLEKRVLRKYLEQTDENIKKGEEEHYFGPNLNTLANFDFSIPTKLYEKVLDDMKRGDNSNKFIEIKDTT
ncbi:hypothetical protein G210_0740 [Candida maltosa Xu316]|uniref:Uncharacterized protein n=1 Tax=Candida maltosa (strain Xu316) TaxID=1245528 RepID=M3K061_CANMX|nr:hypothetical protein G210_0740 [Candida maltosa Xu316]